MSKRGDIEGKYEKLEVKNAKGEITSKFYDRHTLYIELNGVKDADALVRIDAAISTHPSYQAKYLTAADKVSIANGVVVNSKKKPYNSGEVYFYISKHTKLPKVRDCMYIFIYDPELLSYIIGRDAETGLHKVRLPLTAKQQAMKNAESEIQSKRAITSWADDIDEVDSFDNAWDVATRLYHVPGLTFFDNEMFETNWKQHITNPGDIAVMRGYVASVYEGLVPNIIIVSNLPSAKVDPQYAIVMAERFATTLRVPEDQQYKPVVKYEQYQTKSDPPLNRASITITYDPSTMDASFASMFFENYTFINNNTQEHVMLSCKYKRVADNGPSNRGGRGRGGRGSATSSRGGATSSRGGGGFQTRGGFSRGTSESTRGADSAGFQTRGSTAGFQPRR